MTRYIGPDDVRRQVQRMGFVVRDSGLLESAIGRAEMTVLGQDAYASLWLKAAALCQSIDNNQALVDGNKRLAWVCTKVFLAINGQRLSASADDGERFMLDLVAGHADLDSIADWLQIHCVEMKVIDIPE